MITRKGSYRAKGSEDNANSDLFGMRFRSTVRKRAVGRRIISSQSLDDASECTYVLDAGPWSQTPSRVRTVPHRALDHGWCIALFFILVFTFTRQARPQSLVEDACVGNFRELTIGLETPGVRRGTRVLLGWSKGPETSSENSGA